MAKKKREEQVTTKDISRETILREIGRLEGEKKKGLDLLQQLNFKITQTKEEVQKVVGSIQTLKMLLNEGYTYNWNAVYKIGVKGNEDIINLFQSYDGDMEILLKDNFLEGIIEGGRQELLKTLLIPDCWKNYLEHRKHSSDKVSKMLISLMG